ncbi:16991_t:CDS:2 [Cetraspora pellucida]|uniref:16991_t:CDS:1 n=1 Tax=Cetraspora pellucida TaxID=1433469 RepID=A0A9N9JGM7_9GLOM|nr:16991_t:CDS:2 [Cetraspora pellucida]
MNIPKVNDKFSTLETLEEAAQAAAKAQGFAFSRCSSNLDGKNGKSPYVILQCTKGGNWRNNWDVTPESRKRNNEPLSTSMFKCHQKKLLHDLININALTRIITTAINKVDNGGVIMPKDVVNKRARIKYALNEGPNADCAQKLLRLLQQRDYMIELLKTQDGHLTYLFFSHVEAAKHTAKCYEVLIVDATYKTNVYKFPLVSAVGISNIANEKGSLKTFQIVMAWMQNENEDSYKWFLTMLRKKVYDAYDCLPCVFMSDRDQALRNASREVFPEADKMLCIWHLIDQNLKTNCQVMALQLTFDEKHIITAMNSIKNAAEKAYDPKKPLAYVDTLMKDSKLWIYAFTKNFCHMGISTTACAESSHSAFKRAIETASGLESVFENIDQRMRMQNLKTAIYTGTNKVACDPFTLRNSRFSMIIGNVSTYAIDRMKNLLVEIQENPTKYNEATACQCLIRINYKLPCYHTIPKEGPIPLNIIDKCWYLYRPDIKDLLSSSLESLDTDPAFYKVFLKAENTFCQLLDNASIKTEFITRIDQTVTMPLSESLKTPKIEVLKDRYSGTKLTFHKDVDMYEDIVPMFMKEFILNYINVHGDGNCGFRAIAVLLEMSEDEWPTVRRTIFDELINRKAHYTQLFIEGENEYNTVVSIVQWEKGSCSVENWMLMPSFGYPIANAFKRPVHYFSRHQCLTFLPDNILLNRNQPIVFAFIDKQNHYIAMRLKPNAPVPVIVNRWQNICSNQSKIWEKLFEARISCFQKAFEKEHSLYSKDQATIELS